MRANHFQKPEAALQRAQEFISVGKEQDALKSLHDMIKDKRHNKQWSQTHEQIMLKYVELCVNLRNSSMAKDGLYVYKMSTQQVALKSLETVLEKFLHLAEQKTEEAQKTSIEKVEEIDDLDVAIDSPENLLLSVVSGAVTQDRMDRTVLSPWLRFLWDSYRNCLDLLRNNVYVEQLYNHIARQSFSFCARYQRRNEFRKLCDLLRNHFGQLQKSQAMNHSIKLTNIDSLTLMQETRLIQLETAIQMELWQEAYKSAEDLHNMMQLTKDKDKKIVRPASFVNYYDKLALVFWKGGNALFHAASLLQKFNIYKDMKKSFSDEEAMDQSTRVLLATLSIPEGADSPSILTKHLDIEDQHASNIRILSTLLRLPIAPTRAGILREIARFNLPDMASEAARNLYKMIELDFNPLKIATNVQGTLDQIAAMNRPEYSQYNDSIKHAVATRVLKQVTIIYDSLSLDRFKKIIPFYQEIELERFLVDISKHRYIKAQIDHRKKCVIFGPADATLAGDVENEYETEVTENVGLENVRSHIEHIYSQLNDASCVLSGNEQRNKALKKLQQHIEVYEYHKETDYERILMRRKKIESYKENSENVRQEKIQQAQAEANRKEERRRAEELKRLEQENKENEKRRRVAEQEEVQKKIKQDHIRRIQQNPIYQQIIKEKGEEIFQNMDPETVLKEQRLRLDAERREQQTKLQQQERKLDHQVRAFHLEEMVVRKKISDERRQRAPELHDQYEEQRIQKAIQEHEKSFVTYERLQKVKDDALDFIRNVIKSHAEDLEKQRLDYQAKIDTAREKKLKERAEKRKAERRREAEEKKKLEIQRQEAEKEAAPIRAQQEVEFDRSSMKKSVPQQQPLPQPPMGTVSRADEDNCWRNRPQSTQQRQPLQQRQPAPRFSNLQ
ncbi:PCI domain-containing protein [Ditylenchus destructor]|uniref:Eukaryotic translation initiation factor 3 subunit A n=1 Tax=Ditylenchus destructor TaxID=166010 RepID=A0AAD4R5K0_9BILA|nr:PCI domain-containing protein [Ditylenchus destructor]